MHYAAKSDLEHRARSFPEWPVALGSQRAIVALRPADRRLGRDLLES